MAERLRLLGSGSLRALRALLGLIGRLLGRLGFLLRRQGRLWSVGRGVGAAERRRRERFENLGRMVFVLYRRNLVRNADLLAECEKIVALETELDRLQQQGEAIRAEAPPSPSAAALEVAAVPLEVERLAQSVEPGAPSEESSAHV